MSEAAKRLCFCAPNFALQDGWPVGVEIQSDRQKDDGRDKTPEAEPRMWLAGDVPSCRL